AHREWNALHGRPAVPLPPPPRDMREHPLRIGFVSEDFGLHPTGFLWLNALELLDKTQCRLFFYADRPKVDEYTERFRAAADQWRVTWELSAERLAEQVRRDEIDILIDLMGHTGNRLPAFAMRPAPMQVTWLGYVGTTGLAAMDYLLADRFHVP